MAVHALSPFVRCSLLSAALLLTLGVPHLSVTTTSARFDPTEPVVNVRPVDPLISGSGQFSYLSQAVDNNEFNGATADLAVGCHTTCLNELQKVSEWQGFADGYEALALQVKWDAIGGRSFASNARAYFKIEYDRGNGWELMQEDTWVSEIPSCSTLHPAACSPNVVEKDLDPALSSALIKVRATVKLKMTSCSWCGNPLYDSSHMTVNMTVRNIQIVARAPELRVDRSTVTRGDTVKFEVARVPPSTQFMTWKYQFVPAVHSTINRNPNVDSATWEGKLLLSGRTTVVVKLPGRFVNDVVGPSPTVTVNPRSWNSNPLPAGPLTRGLKSFPHPPVPGPDTLGWAAWELDANFTSEKLSEGPNQGLSFVTDVLHDTLSKNFYKWELTEDLEPGTPFFNAQCGINGFISGPILRANGEEHESGTRKGHYQQYIVKLADPAVNYAKWAESQIGSAGEAKPDFDFRIGQRFTNNRTALHNATDVEACNSEFEYDWTCIAGNASQGYRGKINFSPYQPCQ